MIVRAIRAGVLSAAVVLLWGAPALAQGRPKAVVSAVADSDGVHAGSTVWVAVSVSLPEDVHVQSNAPRDPMLIGTAITVQAPAGVSLSDIIYPPSVEFRQAGQATPLAVFEQHFVVALRLAVAATAATGSEVSVPIRLRYQACNATTCFAPAREEVTLSLPVVPASVRIASQHRELFTSLRLPR